MLSISTILAFVIPAAYRPAPAPPAKELDAIGKALLRTADIIRRRGWNRGNSFGVNGEVCIGTAIAMALGGSCYMGAAGSIDVWDRFAASHRSARKHPGSVCYWNDVISKDTKESLIAALEKAAYA